MSQEEARNADWKNVEEFRNGQHYRIYLSMAHEPIIHDPKNGFTQISIGYPPTPDAPSAAQG